MWGFASLISTPANEFKSNMYFHMIEMIVSMVIITIFAFIDSIDCGICADPEDRQAMNNPYILMFIIVGWMAMIIDFVLYVVLIVNDMFDDEPWEAFTAFGAGVREIEMA